MALRVCFLYSIIKSRLYSSSDKQECGELMLYLRQKLFQRDVMHVSTAYSANNSTFPFCLSTPPFSPSLYLFTSMALAHTDLSLCNVHPCLFTWKTPIHLSGPNVHLCLFVQSQTFWVPIWANLYACLQIGIKQRKGTSWIELSHLDSEAMSYYWLYNHEEIPCLRPSCFIFKMKALIIPAS